ncbi:DASH complex subunit Dad3 [Penicillium bovifimosum]|uniref:DASH complex subunit DAD3 n=1 Tax=Penicillium bovifimosum TaxID=126998 RepID=A0A9W9GHE0_9EURO|nr:DASH complex subunit Dad3 [Penicillium bovifimosum]KAJ5120448.1 DASH complex subunit Dad3 [Penicillium bovifimosum]
MSAFTPSDPDHDYSYAEVDPAETTTPPIPQGQSMDTSTDATHTRGHSNNPLLGSDNPLVSDLEQEVLEEYARLLRNVNQLSDKLADLAGDPASMPLDGLRLLERKTATVCTLLKASVYSIVLQQQIWNENEEQQQQQQDQGDYLQGYEGEGDITFQ